MSQIATTRQALYLLEINSHHTLTHTFIYADDIFTFSLTPRIYYIRCSAARSSKMHKLARAMRDLLPWSCVFDPTSCCSILVVAPVVNGRFPAQHRSASPCDLFYKRKKAQVVLIASKRARSVFILARIRVLVFIDIISRNFCGIFQNQ